MIKLYKCICVSNKTNVDLYFIVFKKRIYVIPCSRLQYKCESQCHPCNFVLPIDDDLKWKLIWINFLSNQFQNRWIDEFIKERERYATIGDDLDMAFVELIPGVPMCYNDRHPKPPTPIKPKSPTPVKEPTPAGRFFYVFFLVKCFGDISEMCSFACENWSMIYIHEI